MRQRLAHVHFKNWTPDGLGSNQTTAWLIWPAQVAALKADDYAGYYCLEPHQWQDRRAAVRNNCNQLLALLETE